jgi:16S rRNA (guanine966-N2)-methyltransferase
VSLRIIAGELGGRRIETPPGRATRPTREAVREAWFSALGERVRGSRVLDLFAGSGALGIEALSRGASAVTFVESDRTAIEVLRRNLDRLDVAERAHVRRVDALSFVESATRAGRREWDIVLADPPYTGDAAERLATLFDRFEYAAVLCLEHAPGTTFDREADWQRAYGDTELSFFVGRGERTAISEGASGHEQ